MVLDPNDRAWAHPSKPIGGFMTESEAREVQRTRGSSIMEDAGRGWRVCVASPKPVELVEGDAIRTLVDAGITVIAGGGGGVPVVRDPVDGTLSGRDAVIDKDFAAVRIANTVGADMLL
jgi:carbamate kinase